MTIHIEGIDDDGFSSEVSIALAPGLALTATAQDLESGSSVGWPPGAEIDGALGDGRGKWQLILTASDSRDRHEPPQEPDRAPLQPVGGSGTHLAWVTG